jgi:hypothetical protein
MAMESISLCGRLWVAVRRDSQFLDANFQATIYPFVNFGKTARVEGVIDEVDSSRKSI